MERTGKIIRRSIYTLLKDFHFFTTTPAILVLPFSASVLLSQSLFPASVISFLNLDLSQIIFSFVFSLPFGLSFVAMAKASIIRSLHHHRQHTLSLFCSSFISLCKNLVFTHLCSLFLIITIHIAAFLLILLASSLVKELIGLSLSSNHVFELSAGIVVYMIFTNTTVICNLAMVVAGMENCTGYKAIHKAWVLKRATNSMALLLALPINLGLAAIQALFRYRVLRAYDHLLGRINLSMVLEGGLIAYLFSLLIVLDTIACYLLIRSCESNFASEQAEICCVHIDNIVDSRNSASSQRLREIP